MRGSRYLTFRSAALLITVVAGQSLPGQETAPTGPAFVRFQAHQVGRLPGGYKVAVLDIDRDGKLDIVGLATTPSCLAWYRNLGWDGHSVAGIPSTDSGQALPGIRGRDALDTAWERHILTSGAKEFIDLAAQDVDGDGRVDLAIADAFGMSRTTSGGLVHWLRCPDDPTQEWPMHALGAEPTAHRLRWGDLDGDGRKELIVAPIMGRNAKGPLWDVGVRLTFYRVPAPPTAEPWPPILIDDRLTVLHGLAIVDWDQDGRDDILAASFEGVHLYQSQGEAAERGSVRGTHPTLSRGRADEIAWKKVQLGRGEQTDPARRGASEIAVGKLGRGRGRFLATIEPWHGDKVVVYTPDATPDTFWQRTVIDTTFQEGHALLCADLDGDGADEIVAGYRGRGASLYLYDCRDAAGGKWERIALDEGDMAASGLEVADINGDGRLDVIAIGTATANIKWYENLGQKL